MKNDVKKLTFSGILLAVGFILHQVAPAGVGGVTFDFMLAILFIIIAVNKDLKTAVITGIAAGIITALTTKFPGGQIPNMIEKPITALVVYGLMKIGRKNLSSWNMGFVAFIGTLVSGSLFLGTAAFLVGLPATFQILFYGVVLPSAIGNTIVSIFLYRVTVFSIGRVDPSLIGQLQGQD